MTTHHLYNDSRAIMLFNVCRCDWFPVDKGQTTNVCERLMGSNPDSTQMTYLQRRQHNLNGLEPRFYLG